MTTCDFCNGLGLITKSYPAQYNPWFNGCAPDIIRTSPCQYCKGVGQRENKNPTVYTWEEFRLKFGRPR